METTEYEIMHRVEETHWWYRALHRHIFSSLDEHLPDWKEKPILDAGCGTGAVLQRLGNPEKNVGLDLSPEAILFCKKRGLGNVIQADISSMPFVPESFDAVICSSVLYHRWVPDVAVALGECHRVLKKNGLLLLNLPAFSSLHSGHDEKVFTARRFTAGQISKTLPKTGFEICRLTYWTSLLFPFVWLGRRSGIVSNGRDFETYDSAHWKNSVLNRIMDLEFQMTRKISLPFGVSIFCVARKIQSPESSLSAGHSTR